MRNLKIRSKLLILVTFLLIGLLSIGIVSLYFMSKINAGSTIIAANWMPSIIAAEELNTLTSDYRMAEYAHVVSQNSSSMQEYESKMDDLASQIDDLFNQYNTLITNETDKKLMANAQSAWSNYLLQHDKIISLSRSNKTQQAMVLIDATSKTLFDTASATFLEVVNFNKTGGEQASLDGDQMYSEAQRLMFGILIGFIFIGILGSLFIIRTIVSPIKEIDHVAQKIASGNLEESITYQSKDELGILATNFNATVTRLKDYVNYINEISDVLEQVADGNLLFTLTYDYAGEFAKVKTALEHISGSLNHTLGQINQSADQVASGSDQVSSGAQALSQGATEQASSVEELAATITEISRQVQRNAESAQEASSKTNSVGNEAAESNQRMQAMLSAMSDITHSSNEIGKIIKTIEDIAFQTNILALNAAVEAARAGTAGKGFSVVADEVRNLASKSAEASQNTAALIEGSLKAVENGTQIADATAKSLSTVVQGVNEMAEIIHQISDSSNEQASSIAQVTQGIDQISSVVQNNSATAEESAAASEELSGQAQILKSLVSHFKITTSDASDPSVSQEPPAFVNIQKHEIDHDKY